MKRTILLILILSLVGYVQADISKTDINFESVQPASQLATLLRSKIDDINTEIDQKSYNVGTGDIFYVDSAVGADTYTGTKPEWAFASLDAAIGACANDNGDVIYIMQGHSETKSATGALWTADITGVTIIGLGNGDNRPKFILSHDGADIDITADDVRISNIYVDATGTDSVSTPINLNGEGCILDKWFIRLADSKGQADLGITIGVADGDANDVIIANCIFESPDAGAASAITFAKDMSNVILSNLLIYGDFSTAGVDVPNGAEAQVNLNILNNLVYNVGADDHAVEIYGTGNTGAIVGCTLASDAAATILDAGGLQVSHDTSILIIGNGQPAAMPADKGIFDVLGAYTVDGGADDEDTIMAHLDMILADTGTTLDTVVDAILVDTGTTIPALIGGIGFRGTCVANTGNAEIVECTDLAGFGDDYFNIGWSMICIKNASSVGTSPEGSIIDIIGYSSTAGIFTMNVVFPTEELTTDDEIYVRRVEDLELNVPTILGGSGAIWYIDSGASGDGSGETWENAFASITAAKAGSMTASNGDVVYLAAGHAETVGAALSVNEAGISYIGLGTGDEQSKVTFDTGTAAQFDIAAANIKFENIQFVAGFADLLKCIDIAAGGDGLHLKNCRFVNGTPGTFEFLTCIDFAVNADDVIIEGCEFISVAGTPANEAIKIGEVVDNLHILNNWIYGNYAVAPLWSDAIQTGILIEGNVIAQLTSGQYAVEFATTASGNLVDNRISSPLYATMLLPGSLICIGNIGTTVLGEQGIAIPTSALTTSIAEEDDGSDLERLEYLQNKSDDILAGLRMAGGSVGDVFYADDGGDDVDGLTWATAKNVIKDAYDLASAGDIVFVAPAHVDTIVDAQIAFDTAGVMVIGIGDADNMPKIDMQHGNSSVDVTGASNTIKNINFHSSALLTAIGVDVDAAGFVMEDCLFTDIGDTEFAVSLDLGDTAEYPTIRRTRFESLTATTGATSAISIVGGVITRLIVEDCHIWGDFDNAGIYSTQANLNALIKNNSITNNESGDHAIELTAATTGDLIDNMLSGDTYGEILDPGSMRCFGNMQTVGVDSAAEDVPLVAGRSYSRAMLSGDLNAVQNLFDVDGGPILITFFIGHCTVDADAATTREIELDSDDTGKDYDFSTAVDIQAVNQGDYIVFDETLGESVLTVAALGASGSIGVNVNWMCEEGLIICQNTAADGGAGNIEWYMTFTPLVNGVEVIPQAGN